MPRGPAPRPFSRRRRALAWLAPGPRPACSELTLLADEQISVRPGPTEDYVIAECRGKQGRVPVAYIEFL
jgi:hypothetical protein